MSHISNVFNYQKEKTSEIESPKLVSKLKPFKKQTKKNVKINNNEKSNIKHHESPPKESLNKVALGLQNFLSKALVDNSNDTKYFNVNEEIEEIEKNKKKQKKPKKENEYYHSKNHEFKKLLTLTYDEKNNNLPTNQIGLGLFKKAHSNKKTNFKFKSVKTMTEKKNKFIENNIQRNSDSLNSINHFLSSTEKFNTQKNCDSLNPINEQYIGQLRKNSFDRPKTKPNKIPQSLQDNINLLRNSFLTKVEKDFKRESLKKSNFQNNNNIEHINLNKNNEKKQNFIRRNNRQKSQIINKWLIYSKLISSVEKDNNEDNNYRKIKEKGKSYSNLRKKKKYKTINPIKPKDMQKILKKNHRNTVTIIPFNQNNNNNKNSTSSLIDISKHFNKKKFNQFNKYCDKIKDKLSIHPKKSKTNLLEEEKRDSLLNVKTLTDNVLNPKYKTMQGETDISNLSIIEKKSYLDENEDNSEQSEIGKTKFKIEKLREIRYRHLVRINKLVYDSLSDEESDEVYEITGYINPNSDFKLYFDMAIFIFAFYYFFIFPIILSFYPNKSNTFKSWFIMINLIVDIFYIIDLILGFFTAYYDIEEKFIRKLSYISVNYLSGWFIIDLLSAIPFTTVFSFTIRKNEYIGTYSGQFQIIELMESFRLVKIYKACLYNECSHMLKKKIKIYEKLKKTIEMSIFITIVILHIHFLSCVNIFLSNLEYPNWITVQKLENSSKKDIYITSFYYVFATITTVGYGDIVSINSYERFYNLILLVVGIGIYSYCVSSLSNYVQQVDKKTLDYQEKSDTLEQIRLNHEKMPNELYEKIARFLKYQLENESIDQHEIIDNLPIGLRTTLIMQMYRPIIKNFIFFKTFNSSDFIIKVIMAFSPLLSLKNEKLVNEGDYIEEIIFVKRGVLALELPLPIYVNDKEVERYMTRRATGQFTTFEFNKNFTKAKFNDKPTVINFNDKPITTMTFIKGKGLTVINDNKDIKNTDIIKTPVQQYVKIIEIRKNEHFGDILMFLNKRSPLSMKVKTKYAELFLLNKTDAVEISMSFPKIWNQIIKKSLFNMEQIERLINKTLKFFYKQNNTGKRNSLFMKSLEKKDNYINLDYSNINSKDYELQSIPSSFSNEEESESNAENLITSNEELSSNYDNNESSESSSSSNKSDSNNSNKSNVLNGKKVKILNIKNNETIKEELNEDENEKANLKTVKFNEKEIEKNSGEEKSNKNEKNDNNSNSHIIFSSSSHTKQIYSGTDSKTLKENEEMNLLDFNSLSSLNNTLLYPYSKNEINKEEFPFEINTFHIENNNNLIPDIVPKINNFNINIYGKPTKKLESSKITKYTSYTTSSFYIEIDSSSKKSSEMSKNINFIIVKNESFSLNIHINSNFKKCKSEKKFSLEFRKNERELSSGEEKIIKKMKSDVRKEKKVNSSLKEPKRLSKLIMEADTTNNDKITSILYSSNNSNNNNSKNNSTLNLIEKNIESNSLALNNPKMFYQNYFNNVVNKEKKIIPRKSVVIRLRDIEKIIKTNQPNNKKNKINKTSSFKKDGT